MKMMWQEPLLVRCGYDPYQFALNGKLNGMKSLLIRWYSYIVYRSADRIHVASERDATFVRRRYSLRKNCDIEVRPNWVDTALFKAPVGGRVEPMQDRVLAIGRAVDQKNFQLMIEAIGLGPYGIDIISDDDGSVSLEETAKQFSADVRILARVPHQDLPTVYCCYPIYLITSRFEGHPKSLLEAMACARAVVGTRVPGIEQVIDDEQTGLLVEETPTAVQKAIHRLMSDVALREQLGRAAREEIRQKFSLDDAVSQELEAYRNLVDRDMH
jgi:glycosyltransferase involved in cell wall biosynthesis